MAEQLTSLIIQGLKAAGVRVVAGLPDSLLKGVYAQAARDPDLRYIPVTNEAEGASIVAGAWAAGSRSALVMENSGLRVASEALARIGLVNTLPVFMLMGYRGEVGERFHWGINHGLTMEPMLQALRIPYLMVDRLEDVAEGIARGVVHAANTHYHVAVIFRKPIVGTDE